MSSTFPYIIVVLSWIVAGCGSSSSSPTTQTPAAAPGPGAAPVAGGESGKTVDAPMELPCQVQARDVPGGQGDAVFVACPEGCVEGGTVWGTDVYTDDSAVCPALIHAGVVPPTGGKALVTFVGGQASYPASTRHGVTTVSYPSWGRSFYAQSIDENGRPTSPVPGIAGAGQARLSCDQTGNDLEGVSGGRVDVICPADCAGVGSVWGTDVYTADSVICSAAVHAGVIPAGGGRARWILGGAGESFAGSTRNGVTTDSYEAYDSSFSLQPAGP